MEINYQTLILIDFLNSFAKKSVKGFIPLSKVTKENEDALIYDDKHFKEDGYPLVEAYRLAEDPQNNELIRTYDRASFRFGLKFLKDIDFIVLIDEEIDYAVLRVSDKKTGIIIDIFDGQWKFNYFGELSR